MSGQGLIELPSSSESKGDRLSSYILDRELLQQGHMSLVGLMMAGNRSNRVGL